MGLHDFTFYDLINRNAVTFNSLVAWRDSDSIQSITFSQFKDKVDHLALGLLKAGINKGDRIGVVGKNSLEYFLLYGAAAALGAIMVPINWRLSADELGYNLQDSQCKLVFADQEFQKTVEGLKNRLSTVEEYFNLGPEGGTFSNFGALYYHPGVFFPPEVSTDDGFVIIHTAAVGGRPRGALLSHGNVMFANMHFQYYFHLNHLDVHLNFLPLFHVGGLFMATASFHAGAVNINMSKFDAARSVELIEKEGVSFMMVFSPMLSSILDCHKETGANITSLQIVTGLEDPATIERYQNLTRGSFYCLYGQTETSCLATFGAYNDRPGSAGKMLPLAEVKLVDDYDRPVSSGNTGEIIVKGPMVFKGYWNLPKDNEHTFGGGWHHTGDQGRFDEDGFLWYEGRTSEKELIKPGGENVYPAEVEKAILSHPGIEKAVVIGVPDPKWKEAIKAICQLKEGQNLEPQELIDFVGTKIARFKKPHYVEFVDDFPLLEDGSPDRAGIKESYGEKP